MHAFPSPPWRSVAVAAALLAGSMAHAQSLKNYLKLRAKYGIKLAAGVQALDTLVGSRTVEIAGTIKGSFAMNGDHLLLLERRDGSTDLVHASVIPCWLEGNEVRARLIVSAKRTAPGDDLNAVLLGAAPDSDIATIEAEERAAEEAAARTRRVKPASKAPFGNRARRLWTLPISEVTPIYASYIHSHNPRLSTAESLRIAQALIGFSLKYGVDARLIIAMVVAESDFHPNETSNKGAMGLGQLMPGTARDFGISNAYDTTENLYGTIREITGDLNRYRRQTGDEFKSLQLALAAYNAGSGAVSRAGGIPPYRETRNYVRKVIRLYYSLCGIQE